MRKNVASFRAEEGGEEQEQEKKEIVQVMKNHHFMRMVACELRNEEYRRRRHHAMDCGKAIAHTIVLKIGTCTYYATVSFPNI